MSVERTFVDTNVLVYLFDDAEKKKQARAKERLARERGERELVISTQILQELYVALTRGPSPIASHEIAATAVREAAALTVVQVDVPLIASSIDACQRHQLSFWDALVLRAAAQAGCDRLLSEDLNAGQVIDGVVVENPFA